MARHQSPSDDNGADAGLVPERDERTASAARRHSRCEPGPEGQGRGAVQGYRHEVARAHGGQWTAQRQGRGVYVDGFGAVGRLDEEYVWGQEGGPAR